MKTADLLLMAAVAAGVFYFFRGSAPTATEYMVPTVDGKGAKLHQDTDGTWRDDKGGYWI